MTHKKIVKVLLSLGVLGAMSVGSTALASGFQIFDQDAAQLGNYYAGGAAGTESAGSEFYNPATTTTFDRPQIELGIVDIRAYVRYVGQVNTVAHVGDDPIHLPSSGQGDVDGGGSNYVPDMHLIIPIDQDWSFGFGTTVPFGLETNYPADSFAANAATETTIQTIDLNPSLAYKIDKYLSFGAGFDAEHASGTFDQQMNVNGLADLPDIRATNSIQNNLSDWAYGWNAGVLLQPVEGTRIGLSYRSKVIHQATGTSSVDWNADINVPDIHFHHTFSGSASGPVSVTIPLPATTIFSVAQDVKAWTFMASAYYTQWKSIQSLDLDGVEVAPGITQSNVDLPENFRNTWNLAVGTDYRFAQNWTWQLGAGYDQSPVNDNDRDIRLPDSDRRILATGIGYTPMPNMTINAGYAHFFTNPASIDHTEETINLYPGEGNNVIPVDINEQGTSYAGADVFGLAVNYSF